MVVASGFVYTTPTAQALQYEVEFAASLEGVPQVHDEGVTHRLQDLSLRPCVCRVLRTAHYFRLKDGRVCLYVQQYVPSFNKEITFPRTGYYDLKG